MAHITLDNNDLAVQTEYDPGFVAALKTTIPYTDRKWDPERRLWIVVAQYGEVVAELCEKYFGDKPTVPNVSTQVEQVITLLEVRYIGATKDRGTGDRSAFGWVDGGWNAVFPEPVLREWFDMPASPTETGSLYNVLCVKIGADDSQIKGAFRRLAMQWHPDHCKEPDAAQQFMTIKRAYDTLINPITRARYNAGLTFQSSLRKEEARELPTGYRSPLRCGMIMCQVTKQLGRYNVGKVLEWQDIYSAQGQMLVVSWPPGAEKFEEVWV